MIATILGEDGFRAGMDLYFDRHDGDAATVEQFVACFEDATGTSLKQFALWYAQAGTPEVRVKQRYDKAKRIFEIDCEQILPETPDGVKKKPQHIPIAYALIASDGGTFDTGTTVLHLTKAKQTFKFKNVDARPVPSLLRGYSAPVKLSTDTNERQLTFLMERDQDPFARWQASSDLAMRLMTAALRSGDDLSALGPRISSYADALDKSLCDENLEPAYRAELLSLPSEADIAREVSRNIDPLAIHITREAVVNRIARQLSGTLDRLYDQMAIEGEYSPDAEQCGRRALRNACLSIGMRRKRKQDRQRLSSHYWQATNMTDRALALAIYAQSSSRERAKVLEDFEQTWRDDHLVMDTWFAVQATSPVNATLARIRKLLKHPAYNATTPNKIRAVVGSFAMRNPVQFNRPDGAGYQFAAEQIHQIDCFNPQVAARLMGSFSSWKTLEPARRKLARAAIKQIAQKSGLSRDVYEIATKMLD